MKKLIKVMMNRDDSSRKTYGTIFDRYLEFSKDELKSIILELLYAIHSDTDDYQESAILYDAGENLKERYHYLYDMYGNDVDEELE